MDKGILVEGLIRFLGFVAFVTLHEFAHAWTAVRCGDDTPRLQGRLTLDPIAHIDLVGTIILPLALVIFSSTGSQIVLCGWGKPVMVNLNNLQRRRWDDMLVAIAGPFMNLITAVVMLGGMKLATLAGLRLFEDNTFFNLVKLNVFLCFFNLLPVPPLDGGHIMRNFLNIRDEVYAQLSQYSFIFFIVLFQVPAIVRGVDFFAAHTTIFLGSVFGWHLGFA